MSTPGKQLHYGSWTLLNVQPLFSAISFFGPLPLECSDLPILVGDLGLLLMLLTLLASAWEIKVTFSPWLSLRNLLGCQGVGRPVTL